MNSKQIARIQAITAKLVNAHARSLRSGALSFRVENLGAGEVVLQALHEDVRWYDSHEDFLAVIGVRGGLIRPQGSMANWI